MAVVGGGNIPFVLRLVSCSVAAANKAGNIIRNVLQNGDLGVVDKNLGTGQEFDPQTIADRAAQKCIITSLLERFPAIKIVGEEEDCSDIIEVAEHNDDELVLQQNCPEKLKDIKEEDVVVWVDPLDGTKEFTDGLIEHVTVLIGISHSGRPIAGIIHQPFFKPDNSSSIGRTIWGIEGVGAYGYKKSSHDGLIITTTKSHSSQLNTDAVTAMNPNSIVKAGGSGYKTLLVLLGSVDAYVYASKGTKRWDTCAPQAILRAAGGDMTDILGNAIKYDYTDNKDYMNYNGVVATLADYKHLVSKIPDHVKANFKQ